MNIAHDRKAISEFSHTLMSFTITTKVRLFHFEKILITENWVNIELAEAETGEIFDRFLWGETSLISEHFVSKF